MVQGDIAPSMSAAMGLVGGIPVEKATPTRRRWFSTDWMDTTRSVEVLDLQHHSWPEMLVETAEQGRRRYPARLVAPLANALLNRRSPTTATPDATPTRGP